MSHQLAKLAATARLTDGTVHAHYFAPTVAGGAVYRVQEFLTINACSAAVAGRLPRPSGAGIARLQLLAADPVGSGVAGSASTTRLSPNCRIGTTQQPSEPIRR